MNDTFLSAVLLLLLVADPFGNIPIFSAALRDVPQQRRLAIVLRECLIAFCVLTTFVFAGRPFLETLGLSEISLQIGRAVVLMLVALRMVFPTPDGVYGTSPGGEPFIVPLAVPALAGPSALATVMLLVSKNPARWPEWVPAIAVVMAVSALILVSAGRLQALLGERVTLAFERLMGLVLAAIAVELLLRGCGPSWQRWHEAPVNLLFEEDGAFRAGSVLSSTDASYQVELPSGKRTKVKRSHVLLQFDDLPAAKLLERAQAESESIDLDFLWEAAPQDEFGFRDLARDYYGAKPTSVQEAALLVRLHAAPIYFYRKGRGRYRPAPPETLKAALAAVERKRRQDELRQHYVDALKQGIAPAAIAAQAVTMLVHPDRASVEFKALEQAAAESQTTPLRLLLTAKAIESPYRWHVDSFLAQHFPRGAGFPANLPSPAMSDDLPLAEVAAFSIDDSATTEIDDAFSVTPSGDGRMRVGIHIAAPAVALEREHALDALARSRMSTVYAPGLKITMLPPEWVVAYSLTEAREVPVLSLYADVHSTSFELLGTESRIERVRIAANLRHDRLDDIVTDESIADASFAAPFAHELSFLWRFARSLLARREAVRGRPNPLGRIDYSFEIDGEGEHAHVSIKPRRRGPRWTCSWPN